MTDDPKLIGNICRWLIGPAGILVTAILVFLRNDVRTSKGILVLVVSVLAVLVLLAAVLPLILNALNALAVRRWRDKWVVKYFPDFCRMLVEEENGLMKLRQVVPPSVGGRIARSEILRFLSLKADFWS